MRSTSIGSLHTDRNTSTDGYTSGRQEATSRRCSPKWNLRLSPSVSSGRARNSAASTDDWPVHPGAEYRRADVRDRAGLDALIGEIRPDLVFHVATQRDPGNAEVEVHRAVSTNVLGTRTVLTAAAEAGVPQVVCASTGKALRPYPPDMYTASKRPRSGSRRGWRPAVEC